MVGMLLLLGSKRDLDMERLTFNKWNVPNTNLNGLSLTQLPALGGRRQASMYLRVSIQNYIPALPT